MIKRLLCIAAIALIPGAACAGILLGTLSASHSTMPPGVTLQAIDGETLTGTTQSHNYFNRNGFSAAVSMGWDNPSFFPIGPFASDYSSSASAYAGKTIAQVWSDVGWNMMMNINSVDPSLALTNGVSLIDNTQGSAFVGSWPLPYVGLMSCDEPQQYVGSQQWNCTTVPFTTTANSISDNKFWYFNNTWNWNAGAGISGSPAPGTPTSNMSALLTTPNATQRHMDTASVDMYWSSEQQWGFMVGPGGAGTQVYGIGGGGMTDAQALRGSNYGDMIDIQRVYQTTFPAPIFSVVEDGNPFESVSISNWITPPFYNWALWSSVIHGARGLIIFDHNFGSGCQAADNLTSDICSGYSSVRSGQTVSMYNQMKTTQTGIKSLASVISSPFAIGYASVSPARYNYPGSGPYPTAIASGIDMMSKWDGSNFYIFATTSYAQTATNISATFTVAKGTTATVLNESRSISIIGGQFTDTFATAATVHIYQIN